MKRVVLIVASIMMLFSAVHAEMSVTPKVGFSVSTYQSDEIDDYFENFNSRKPSLLGLRVAAEMNMKIENFVTGVELGYARRGVMLELNMFDNDVDIAHKLTYLDISPVIGYELPVRMVSFIPRFKPTMSIFVSGVKSEVINGDENVVDITSDEIENLDFSLDFGLDAVVGDKLVFGLGYDIGLMDVIVKETHFFAEGYNRALYFTMGYKINI